MSIRFGSGVPSSGSGPVGRLNLTQTSDGSITDGADIYPTYGPSGLTASSVGDSVTLDSGDSNTLHFTAGVYILNVRWAVTAGTAGGELTVYLDGFPSNNGDSNGIPAHSANGEVRGVHSVIVIVEDTADIQPNFEIDGGTGTLASDIDIVRLGAAA